MRLRILYVAYPLLPVSDASAGGAEQMLWTLEREMHRRGHLTTVAACANSQVAGRLFATGDVPTQSDTFELRNGEHQQNIRDLLRRESFDLIHDKSGSFFAHSTGIDIPILATVHLPRSFYGDVAWRDLPSHVSLNCVSAAQAHTFADVPNLEGWVQNGIDLKRFLFTTKKKDYLLWLGRICEEKAPHLAIEAARRTGKRLVIVGQVYPFKYHQEYFAHEVEPMLGGAVEFIESPSFEQKIELLSRASALLVPSFVDETSSLVTLEAMACGTPVVAFRRGALPEIVQHDCTGYLVNDVEEMADAVMQAGDLRAENCRAHVEQHFAASRMTDDYENLYHRVLARSLGEAA